MRLFWNAGAVIGVGLLILGASFAAGSARPARADTPGPGPVRPVADLPHRHYTGLAEHFQAANSAHDGKLTLQEATRAGWKRVARHFDEIDTAHAGFVTEAQIHAYNVAHHHGRKQAGAG